MTAVASYGAINGTLDNDPLQIEVVKTIRQRPIMASASWLPEVGAVAADFNAAARLVVYRGRITSGVVIATLEPFMDLSSLGCTIFYDAFVQYSKDVTVDFTRWPDELVRAQPNEPLGALLLRPHDMVGLGADVPAFGSLVFVGSESPDDGEADVRRWKAK